MSLINVKMSNLQDAFSQLSSSISGLELAPRREGGAIVSGGMVGAEWELAARKLMLACRQISNFGSVVTFQNDTMGDGVVSAVAKGNVKTTISFNKDGSIVEEGLLSKSEVGRVDADLMRIFLIGVGGWHEVRGLGGSKVPETVLKSAAQYMRCIVSSGDEKCGEELSVLQNAVQQENTHVASAKLAISQTIATDQHNQLQQDISSTVSKAESLWKKVDTFIAEAKRVDADEDEIAALERLVAKYAAARPVFRPATLSDAERQYQISSAMEREFGQSEAVKEIVEDEGSNSGFTTMESSRCGARYENSDGTHGWGYRQIYFSGYSISVKDSFDGCGKKEPTGRAAWM